MAGSFDQEKPLLSRILQRIPGFGGYVEHEARQASEAQTRAFVTDELQKAKEAIDQCAKSLVEATKIDESLECQTVRDSIDAIVQQMKSQMPGHSSFFGASRIDDDKLEDIYDSDVTLMDHAEELAELARTLSDADTETADVLKAVAAKVQTFRQQIANRDRLLSDL